MDPSLKAGATPQSTSPDNAQPGGMPKARLGGWWLYIFSFILLATLALGFIRRDLRDAYRDTLAYWDVRMSNSDLERVSYATLWLKERRTDVVVVARNPLTTGLLGAAAKGSNLARTRPLVEKYIDRIARDNGFAGGLIADTTCRIVAQEGVPAEAMADILGNCPEALRAGDFKVFVFGGEAAHPWVCLSYPVLPGDEISPGGQDPRRALGVVLMLSQPWKALLPSFEPEGERQDATETLVVWPSDDETIVFSPHLAIQGVRSIFHRPRGDQTLESLAVRKDNVEFGEYIDYRGVRVLGAARFLESADASVIRKVERKVALAEFQRRSLLEWLVGVMFVLLLGSAIAVPHHYTATQNLKDKLRQQQTLLDLKRNVEVSEQRYRELVDSLEAIVWEDEGATLHPTFVSKGAEKILGYSVQEWTQTPGFWSGHLHPEDCEKALAVERLVQEKCASQVVEYRMFAADGRIVWFRDYHYANPGPDGKAAKLRGIMVDVTEIRKAEEALRESRQLLETTLYSLRDAVLIIGLARGEILDCNPGAMDMFGYRREEMVGHSTLPLHVSEVARLEFRERLAIAVAEKGYMQQFEFRMRRRDGSIFPTSHTVAPLRDSRGNQTGWVSLVQDITERKRAEAVFHRYGLLSERSRDAFLMLRRADGRILEANGAAEDLYGYLRQELLTLSIYALRAEQVRKSIAEDMARADSTGILFETVHQRKDGSTFPVEVSSRGATLDGTRVLISVIRDVTERKRAEAELAERLRFESQLAELSARFVNVSAEQLDGEIQDAQGRICQCLGLDGCSLWQVSGSASSSIKLTHNYRTHGGPAIPINMDAQEYFPWSYQQIMSGKAKEIVVSSLAELPEEADRDRQSYTQFGVKSVLTIGLAAGGGPPMGALAFGSTRAERKWPVETVNRLQLVAQLFSNALARRGAERALRDSEERFRSLSNAALEGIMIHHQGVILDLNPAFARLFGYEQPQELIGKNGMEDLIAPESRERLRQRMQGQEMGPIEVMCIRKDGTTFLGETDSRLVTYLGREVRIVSCRDITQLKQAQEDLRQTLERLRALATRLQQAREEERKRVAREIHDHLGQSLTAIKLDVISLFRLMPDPRSELLKRKTSIMGLVNEMIQTTRRLATALRPGLLDDLGLVAAIEWSREDFEARTGTKCWLDLPRENIVIDSERATAIFRILQESLANVARHANAHDVEIRLARENDGLTLEVSDDGDGFAEDKLGSGRSLGILGMHERALVLGGALNIHSAPGQGTTVRVWVPMAPVPNRESI